MRSINLLTLALIFLGSLDCFAWSTRCEVACTTETEGLIATLYTPIRPFGMVSDETWKLVEQRCEALGGTLGEKSCGGQPPNGAR